MKSIKFIILFISLGFALSGCTDEATSDEPKYFGEWNLDCSCEDNLTPGPDDIVLEYVIWINQGGGAGQVAVTNIHQTGGIDLLFVDVLGPNSLVGNAFQAEVNNDVISIHYIHYNFDCEATGIR